MSSDNVVDGKLSNSAKKVVSSRPFSSFLKKIQKKISNICSSNEHTSIENEVAELIEEHDPQGLHVSTEERNMLHNIFAINECKVDDVMVNRTDIIAVEEGIQFEELRNLIIDKEHTRMPVYKGTMDNIVGFIHAKDLFSVVVKDKYKFSTSDFLRKILFVPPSMKVIDLLVKMRRNRTHIALVLDEYGGTEGLVTLEDIVEEIVGDIEDEHDEVEIPDIIEIDENTIEVSARSEVEFIEKKFGVQLKTGKPEEDFDTIGGFIFFLLERVPEVNEIIRHSSGVEFKVIDAEPSKIHRLIVKK